jgi:hypothetical protein
VPSHHSEVMREAAAVVNLFDQANTNNAVIRMGDRGQLLSSAVNDLRAVLNRYRQMTILTQEQVDDAEKSCSRVG